MVARCSARVLTSVPVLRLCSRHTGNNGECIHKRASGWHLLKRNCSGEWTKVALFLPHGSLAPTNSNSHSSKQAGFDVPGDTHPQSASLTLASPMSLRRLSLCTSVLLCYNYAGASAQFAARQHRCNRSVHVRRAVARPGLPLPPLLQPPAAAPPAGRLLPRPRVRHRGKRVW